MVLVSKLPVMAIFVAAYAVAGSWPQEPDGFKGIRFGMSQDEARQANQNVTCPTSSSTTCFLRLDFGSFNVQAYFRFTLDGMSSVSASFDSSRFDEIKEAFEEKYGKPDSDDTETVSTRAGARLTNERLRWTGRKVYILLERYGSSIGEGLLGISLQSDLEWRVRKEREAAKKALE